MKPPSANRRRARLAVPVVVGKCCKHTAACFILYCVPAIKGWSAAHDSTHIFGLNFYVLLTVHPLYNLFQIQLARCTLLLSIFISTLPTCFGQPHAHHQENLLYICDTSIFHCVLVAIWSADQTATHTE